MPTVLVGHRVGRDLGVVKDTVYIRCYWPRLDEPTELFAKGSSGIEVEGPPTPRNVVFPKDTVFRDYYPDAQSRAVDFVLKAFSNRAGLVNFTPDMVAVYLAEYYLRAANLPATATIHSTRPDCHFLYHEEPNPDKDKPDRYIAELKPEQVEALVKGDTNVETLKADAEFVPISVSRDKAETIFKLEDGALAGRSKAVKAARAKR